jgi:hypothetical protein
MPQNANEQTLAYFQETTRGTGPADWDVDAAVVEFLAIGPDPSGMSQTTVDNRNLRRRAYATRQKLLGLRSEAQASFGMYLSGSNVTTAASAQAATFPLVEMLRNAWCGVHRGWASAVVTPDTHTVAITVGQGTNHPAGEAIFAVDADGLGQFAIVASVATDDVTLLTDTDNDVATVGAAITCYPNTRGMTNRGHATHIWHSLYFRGEEAEDNYEARGCKINVTGIENGEAGGDASLSMEVMASTFSAETVTRAALTGTPAGPTPPIVGRAGTAVRIANVGTPTLTDVGAYSFSFTPGVAWQRVPGITTEGLLGFNGTGFDATELEIVVPYDESWLADFRAGTRKHIMIQVGSARGDAWALYFPNAELMDDPKRGVSADETAITLRFRALEYPGTTHTDGTANYEMERSKFRLLLAA